MAAVIEEPISPELVLVAPPDEARRARERLLEPPELLEGERAPSRLGPTLFALAVLVNCVLPTALLLALR